MRALIACVVLVNLFLTGASLIALNKAEQRISALEAALRAEKNRPQPQPAQAQHRYRFERNGASLWRYDESTGESCQIESNVTDNWVGGKCPN